MVLPFQILWMWIRGLLSIGLLVLAGYLLYQWYGQSHVYQPGPPPPAYAVQSADPVAQPQRVFHFEPGLNRQTALLLGGVTAALICFLGGPLLVRVFYPRHARRGEASPRHERTGQFHRVRAEDGTELHVEIYGKADGPTLVCTHGWGADATEWFYARRELADDFRLVLWDAPGLGRSARAAGRDYSMENLARCLHAVVQFAARSPQCGPITLVGHSIGGMINLQYARQYPQEMGRTVHGIVEAQTTYTDPARTTRHSRIYTALQKPVLEPLTQLSIYLSPVLWIMSCISYLNGSTHLSNKRSGFAGHETYEQNDFIARYGLKASPAVLCRGVLGMAHWDADDSLASITVPTLLVPGDRDPNCLPEASSHMEAQIPKARSTPIIPGKHYGLLEQHTVFAELVRSFALGLPRPRSA